MNKNRKAGINPATHFRGTGHDRRGGFTLVEFIVATSISMILMTVVCLLTINGARTFLALGNYSQLDSQSRNALDRISQELRQSTALLAFTTNANSKSLTLTNTDQGKSLILTWTGDTRTLSFSGTGQRAQNLLTECDRWDFALYNRAPNVTPTNITFYPATNGAGVLDPTRCKLVNMSWKCSRTIMGSKLNTESVQTAQIVLRNKIR
jgi:hypothetical protein